MVAVIIPALNEESYLAQACASLGFGDHRQHLPDDCYLVVVDNGSTDATVDVAHEIQRLHDHPTVIVESEPVQGYVYPRATGVRAAMKLARQRHVEYSKVVIVQADADTTYVDGYIQAISSGTYQGNSLAEGIIEYDAVFTTKYRPYAELVSCIDSMVLSQASGGRDYVVVDAVAAYRLDDYLRWGGHQPEFDSGGREILAETSRLFMRGCTFGAVKTLVPSALAYPSSRKLLKDTSLDLAMGGFPRDPKWTAWWREHYRGPRSLEEVLSSPTHPDLVSAVHVRERHLIALFGVLPLHIDRALGRPCASKSGFLFSLLEKLPFRSCDDLRYHPGRFVEDVLRLVDDGGWHSGVFSEPCLPRAERG